MSEAAGSQPQEHFGVDPRTTNLRTAIAYFSDTANYFSLDPKMIRFAGDSIAGYFSVSEMVNDVEEDFAITLDSTISATAAILDRTGQQRLPHEMPQISFLAEATQIAAFAWTTCANLDDVRNTRPGLEANMTAAHGHPRKLMDVTRSLTRDAHIARNPTLLQPFARIGVLTARLLASAAESGRQLPVDNGSSLNYKDYIARNLAEALGNISRVPGYRRDTT
jgi:hypothetical protein